MTTPARWSPRTPDTRPELSTIEPLTEPATAELFYETTPTGAPSPEEIPDFATVADLRDAARPTDDDRTLMQDRIDPTNPTASYARTVAAHCAHLATGTAAALAVYRPLLSTLDTAVCDLLADLLHAADLSGMGADAAMERARTHYDAETLGR